jgi:hypothetical protein
VHRVTRRFVIQLAVAARLRVEILRSWELPISHKALESERRDPNSIDAEPIKMILARGCALDTPILWVCMRTLDEHAQLPARVTHFCGEVRRGIQAYRVQALA